MSEQKQAGNRLIYFGASFYSFWILSFFSLLFISEYLGRDRISRMLSFHAAEPPGNIAPECLSNPIGVHYFGDLLSVLCHARESSPYLSPEPTNYFPFSYVVVKPLSALVPDQYSIALGLFLLICLAAIIVSFFRAGHDSLAKPQTFVFLLAPVILSYPMITSIDRANIQLLVTVFLLVGCLSLVRQHPTSAAVWFGLAAAIKGYPGIFLLLLVGRRDWKNFAIGAATTVLATVVSLATFSGGFVRNFREMIADVNGFRSAGDSYLRFNNSLRGLFVALSKETGGLASKIGDLALGNYSLIVGILAVAISASICVRNTPIFRLAILCSVFCSLLVDLTAGYTLGGFIVAVALLSQSENDAPSRVDSFLVVLLALLLVPRGIPLGADLSDNGVSLQTITSPLIMLAMLATIIVAQIRQNAYGMISDAKRLRSILSRDGLRRLSESRESIRED